MIPDVQHDLERWKKPFILRAALDEIDVNIRVRSYRWLKRAALFGLAVILVIAFLR